MIEYEIEMKGRFEAEEPKASYSRRSCRNLSLWQKAHAFVLAFYELSQTLPTEEKYGITAQAKRSAISIPANIAEGFGKSTIPDKLRYLDIAQGSLEEIRYYLILINDLHMQSTHLLSEQLDEVERLLYKCKDTLRRRLNNETR